MCGLTGSSAESMCDCFYLHCQFSSVQTLMKRLDAVLRILRNASVCRQTERDRSLGLTEWNILTPVDWIAASLAIYIVDQCWSQVYKLNIIVWGFGCVPARARMYVRLCVCGGGGGGGGGAQDSIHKQQL